MNIRSCIVLIAFAIPSAHSCLAQAQSAQTSKYCGTCKRSFPLHYEYCAIDGTPLNEHSEKKHEARECSRCGKSYDPPACYCPLDGAPLRILQSPNSALPRRSPLAQEAAPLPPGQSYIQSLRAELMDGKPGKGANKLKTEFDQSRGLTIHILAPPSFSLDDLRAQLNILRPNVPIHIVGSVDLHEPKGCRSIEVSYTSDKLVIRELPSDFFPVPPGTDTEIDLENTDAISDLTWLCRTLSRHIEAMAYDHFSKAIELEKDGTTGLAMEEHIRFLFMTAGCATPQATRSNSKLITRLQFSALDWLWGEKHVANVMGTELQRRLPLGFRAVDTKDQRVRELPERIVSLKDGKEMVLVPADRLAMGNENGLDDERPEHEVQLSPFYVDVLETSVAEYEKYELEVGKVRPHRPETFSAADLDLPVSEISWFEAMGYSQWTRKSLPTEAQWERAARGWHPANYPWQQPMGKQYLAKLQMASDRSGPMSVHSFPASLNPYGCRNLIGNVAEWCRDWFADDIYARGECTDPAGPPLGTRRVIRGGSWLSSQDDLLTTRRFSLGPSDRHIAVGFRCVLSISNGEE